MKGSILLVEDSPTQAAEYRAYLQRAGYEVHISTDGFDALVLANQNIDAIILDINLPTLDGFQVCRRLRRDPDTSGIPIVMLTSAMSATETLFGLEVGANDYIPKDEFAIEQLLVSLEALLEEKQHDEQ
jgi:DNA-binding response OmpR family regulator